MDANDDDTGLLRLLVRNVPFILSRPDVAAASVPGGKSAGVRSRD